MQSQNRTFPFSIHIAHNAHRLFVYIFMNEFSSENIISEFSTFFLKHQHIERYLFIAAMDWMFEKTTSKIQQIEKKKHLREDEMRLHG